MTETGFGSDEIIMHVDSYDTCAISKINHPPPGCDRMDKMSDDEKEVERKFNIDKVEKGGFIRRCIAFLIDLTAQMLILDILAATAFYALRKGESISGIDVSYYHMIDLVVPFIILSFIVGAIYFTFFHSVSGQTPGKMILRVKVVGRDGHTIGPLRALIRWAGYFISALPFFSGFMLALISKNRQALHDKIAATYVVDLKSLLRKDQP